MTNAIALTPAQELILGFIAQRKAERALIPRPTEIAVALDIPREEVTSAIAELQRLELLEHNPRRSRSLVLTPAGEHLAQSLIRPAELPCPRRSFC